MELIGKSKISKHKINERHTYPLVRLPETHLDLAGNIAHIYETYYKGKKALVITFNEECDGEITQPLSNTVDIITQYLKLESRVNVLEEKLKTASLTGTLNVGASEITQSLEIEEIEPSVEFVVNDSKTVSKEGGPAEIRTQDLRHVKATS